jgi:hypothetical protein
MDDKKGSKFLAGFVARIRNITQTMESSGSTISLNLSGHQPSPGAIDRISDNSIPLIEQHQPNKLKADLTSEAIASPLSDRPPGNYYLFDFLLEITNKGKTYLGHPCVALRLVTGGHPVIRWGTDPKYLVPTSAIAHIPWLDDPEKGFSQRELVVPEDLISGEGTIGGKRYFFEQILDLGNNVVVYSIYSYVQQFRIAYGFSRDMFKAAAHDK